MWRGRMCGSNIPRELSYECKNVDKQINERRMTTARALLQSMQKEKRVGTLLAYYNATRAADTL